MQSIYIGRQPILDSNTNLRAYEILYKESQAVLNRYSSASIINNVLNKFGTHLLLGDRRGFVKIDEKFLMHDIIFSIPNEFFVFSLLESVEINEKTLERIAELHEKGFVLSLESFTLDDAYMLEYKSLFEYLSFIKININTNSSRHARELIAVLKTYSITIVADNVTTLSEYNQAITLGCEWFQGYFFAEPVIIENKSYKASQFSVLKLYNLLMQDVNIDEITKEFELNHEITVQLLQFINSGAFHFKTKISSIHHVLTLVGRIPLGQWLMLMIYAKSVSKERRTPLMLMVKNRTELMENILKSIKPDAGSNSLGEAYFVGVLSLIDTVFGVPLESLLEQMNVSDAVKGAILRDEGELGEIFMLVKSIEQFQTEAISAFEKKYKLSTGTIEKLTLASMKELNSFECPEVS